MELAGRDFFTLDFFVCSVIHEIRIKKFEITSILVECGVLMASTTNQKAHSILESTTELHGCAEEALLLSWTVRLGTTTSLIRHE